MSRQPAWSIVVIRAWAETGHVRVRLLRSDTHGHADDVVVASVPEAVATLAAWLAAVADADLDGQHPGSASSG